MENTVNTVLQKKMDEYGFSYNNVIADQELTVTITLNEYRELIKEVATKKADINAANSARWDVESKLDKALKRISELERKILDGQMGENEDE